MLDVALTFIAKSLNTYLTLGEAVVTRLVDDTGKWACPEGKLGVSLLNVEEERVTRSQLPDSAFVNARHVVIEPELKLNLSVVLAANFSKHEEAWRCISQALTFFHEVPVFTLDQYPDLDPRIERLTMELLSLSFEQLNQLWAFIGARQLPSVFYRVRMVVSHEQLRLAPEINP